MFAYGRTEETAPLAHKGAYADFCLVLGGLLASRGRLPADSLLCLVQKQKQRLQQQQFSTPNPSPPRPESLPVNLSCSNNFLFFLDRGGDPDALGQPLQMRLQLFLSLTGKYLRTKKKKTKPSPNSS